MAKNETPPTNRVSAAWQAMNGNRDIARRVIGVIFMLTWLAVYIAERVGYIAHTGEFLDTAKDFAPLIIGTALFAPDVKDILGFFRPGARK